MLCAITTVPALTAAIVSGSSYAPVATAFPPQAAPAASAPATSSLVAGSAIATAPTTLALQTTFPSTSHLQPVLPVRHDDSFNGPGR